MVPVSWRVRSILGHLINCALAAAVFVLPWWLMTGIYHAVIPYPDLSGLRLPPNPDGKERPSGFHIEAASGPRGRSPPGRRNRGNRYPPSTPFIGWPFRWHGSI